MKNKTTRPMFAAASATSIWARARPVSASPPSAIDLLWLELIGAVCTTTLNGFYVGPAWLRDVLGTPFWLLLLLLNGLALAIVYGATAALVRVIQ